MPPSVLEEAKENIISRLTELEDVRREYDDLLAAASDLKLDYQPKSAPRNGSSTPGVLPAAARTGTRSGSSRAARSKRAQGRGGRRIAPAGQRRQQMLDLVNATPEGITVAQVAEKLGLKDATSLFRVQKQLVADGAVRKDGAKMLPKATTEA